MSSTTKISEDEVGMLQHILSRHGLKFEELLEAYQRNTQGAVAVSTETWLTMAQATAYTKLSRWTISRFQKRGLKVLKSSDARCGRLLISKASLDALLESLSISGRR